MKFFNSKKEKEFTHTQNFKKFGLFDFLKKEKNSLNSNNSESKNLVGGFTRTQNSTKSGILKFIKNIKNSPSQNNLDNGGNLVGGFTLVETLVAIAIFATAITGLISITARGVNDNVFVKNKLIASYLAQEGVEIVRNIRDTSALTNSDPSYWAEFINEIADCYSSNGIDSCIIDRPLDIAIISPCVDGECPNIGYDSDLNLYGYMYSEDSIFTRKITITPVPLGSSVPTNEILINSSVSWNQGSNTYTTTYQYNLFNWIFN